MLSRKLKVSQSFSATQLGNGIKKATAWRQNFMQRFKIPRRINGNHDISNEEKL